MKNNNKTIKLLLILSLTVLAACATKSPRLSLDEGKLRLCPKSPNCVSSESDIAKSQIAPITYQGDAQHALENMKETLLYMGGHLQKEEAHYLWVTFSSKMLRFVDDVEVRLVEDESILHIRSASRTGYSDMGVNRKRVKHIRRHFNEISHE
jgi:uncharacterized protein (DUF1499 family)